MGALRLPGDRAAGDGREAAAGPDGGQRQAALGDATEEGPDLGRLAQRQEVARHQVAQGPLHADDGLVHLVEAGVGAQAGAVARRDLLEAHADPLGRGAHGAGGELDGPGIGRDLQREAEPHVRRHGQGRAEEGAVGRKVGRHQAPPELRAFQHAHGGERAAAG